MLAYFQAKRADDYRRTFDQILTHELESSVSVQTLMKDKILSNLVRLNVWHSGEDNIPGGTNSCVATSNLCVQTKVALDPYFVPFEGPQFMSSAGIQPIVLKIWPGGQLRCCRAINSMYSTSLREEIAFRALRRLWTFTRGLKQLAGGEHMVPQQVSWAQV